MKGMRRFMSSRITAWRFFEFDLDVMQLARGWVSARVFTFSILRSLLGSNPSARGREERVRQGRRVRPPIPAHKDHVEPREGLSLVLFQKKKKKKKEKRKKKKKKCHIKKGKRTFCTHHNLLKRTSFRSKSPPTIQANSFSFFSFVCWQNSKGSDLLATTCDLLRIWDLSNPGNVQTKSVLSNVSSPCS